MSVMPQRLKTGLPVPRVTFYVPGLLGPFPVQWKSELNSQFVDKHCKALTTLLSCASMHVHRATDFYQTTYHLLTEYEDVDVPIASFRHRTIATTPNNKSWYLNCDPVIVLPDREQAFLTRLAPEHFEAESCQFVIDKINQHYKDEPWELRFITPHQWVIESEKHYSITTTSLMAAQQKNIDHLLPAGPDALYWHQILNEIQMLIYQLNQLSADNKLDIAFNSVWLWGQGSMSVTDNATSDIVYTDNEDVMFVAQAFGLPCRSLNSFKDMKTDDSAGTSRVLLVSDRIQNAILQHDITAWLDALNELDDSMFIPLYKKLKNNTIKQISIITDENIFTTTNKNLHRWWRRRKKISDFIQWQ